MQASVSQRPAPPCPSQRRPRGRPAGTRANRLFFAARRPYKDPPNRHYLGKMDVECPKCKALHWRDEKLTNSSNARPQFGRCCNSGKVDLPLLQSPPEPLRALLDGQDEAGAEFREHILQYNSAMAFTSLGVNQDASVNRYGSANWVFRICGQLCHYSGMLEPESGAPPSYSQLYLYDAETALAHRLARNDNVNRNTMETVQSVIDSLNPYARMYRHAHEVLKDYPDSRDISVALRVMPGNDRRRYNLPSANEVAMILPGDGSATDPRDIVLHRRQSDSEYPLLRINDSHPGYAPLQYPILFPRGEAGWHYDLYERETEEGQDNSDIDDDDEQDGEQSKGKRRISQTRFAAFRLHARPAQEEYSTLLRGGRLLQQYSVDMWASAEQNRLRYHAMHQRELRASLYSGLQDATQPGDDSINLQNLGQKIVLASSYTGGPRHMQQRYQDAMAIARYFHTVDIFLTMTANPHWKEIEDELYPWQSPYDRPDLVARVFEMKKKALVEDIKKNGIFGRAVAFVYTIEFQKRGLPHMHLLIFLEQPFKLLTAQEIDSAISAEWPDPDTQPLLFETVKTCMVHGPCGTMNPRSPCMNRTSKKCEKFYPKPFQRSTTLGEDGYPLYRRRDDGRAYDVGRHKVDNSWIVPYNPYLSAKYNCHINVECAVNIKSIKYPFKYIHKGGDKATLQRVDNEIETYIDGRYIGPPEAMWRIFHFDTHTQVPNVVRLQVHLPGHHLVVFDPGEDPSVLLARAKKERTTLTAWFEANKDPGARGDVARKCTYQEIPQAMVWNSRKKVWKVRKRAGYAIGRMYYVAPTAGERFYLRYLLTVVKGNFTCCFPNSIPLTSILQGATSFKDLRSYRGVVHETFEDACRARGLLQDDGEWAACLEEAGEMQVGSRLRQLFASLLLFVQVDRPEELWHRFRGNICDDLRHHLQQMGYHQVSQDDVYDYGLHLIAKILMQSGRSLPDRMPQPQRNWQSAIDHANPLIAEQLDYDRQHERERASVRIPSLNAQQDEAFNAIMDSVTNSRGHIFFLQGPGGTGKTFVYNTLCHHCRADARIVLVAASSGIAALLIVGGRTAHQLFKIPIINLFDTSFCKIPKESQRADLLRATSLIIWDEALMHRRNAHEALDRTLRDIRDCDKPFGGITTVFGGDVQQILPVVPRGNQEDIVEACLLRSPLWPSIRVLRLSQNQRLSRNAENQQFAKWLLDVGQGRNSDDEGYISLPDNMCTSDQDSLIDFVYPIVGSAPLPHEYYADRLILAPRNQDVHSINDEVLNRLPGTATTFFSSDAIEYQQGADSSNLNDAVPVEYLRSLNASNLPPGELRLKTGAPIILLRNLAPAQGLCNGTRLLVRSMSQRVLEATILSGDHHGEVAFIPRLLLSPSEGNGSEYAFKLTRLQFPVRLAFAVSINKAQGQSVNHVGLDLRVPVFSHGQLYVALSRATSRDRIRILLPPYEGTPRTLNIVYPEVLCS